uniref:prostaglandin E synthase 2-like n=1 Tax=Erigeron canadensis TaxID=72917 RepID=UPI001CB95836|nr:prostaglandin E synthase 2-like [Erigeron canadensis]
MATTAIRKVSRLAATAHRAAAVASFSTTATTRRHSILQTASYSTINNNNTPLNSFPPTPRSQLFDRINVVQNCARCHVASYSTATSAEVVDEKYVPNDVVLYQYQACPFCNKVKAFLEYNDVPYKIVEVNPMNKKEIKWSDYKKVPILMVDGEQMVDSSEIIDKMYQRMHPDSVSEDEETQKWRRWVDNHLVHVLSPNIYRSPSEALESFDYITSHGNFSFTEKLVAKYGGAAAMYFVSKKLKKRHNITDERKALYEAAETWVYALAGRQYLGGSEPNLADLAVFGVLRPIRDLKSGKDMVANTHIGEWFARMESQMKPNRGMTNKGA